MDIEDLIEKWTLKNALDHGKASMGSVIGKIIAASPEVKKDMKSLSGKVSAVVSEINKLSKEEIEKRISKYQFEEKKVEERKVKLPPHPFGDVEIVTRFAPEPGGYLHIGHIKSALISWEGARQANGKFLLRFDDTNPELSKQEYVDRIKKDLKWLEIDWDVETYTSDHMKDFYFYASELIKKERAYICECDPDLIKQNRRGQKTCSCRKKTQDKNIEDLEKMIKGEYEEGERILRFMGDMTSQNTAMRDPTLMRIIKKEHYRQGKSYVAWPSYDLVTPILDSINGITYSLRSKEYELRDELYYAIIEVLELRKPFLVSFARLQIKNNPTSKRVIRELVQNKKLTGWDDPRLLTIAGMKRRGILPEAIRTFALSFGIGKSESKDATIDPMLLENRKLLDTVTKRYFFVKNPTMLEIKGFNKDVSINFHTDEKLGKRTLSVKERVFVDKKDISEGEILRLKDLCNIKITGINEDEVTAEVVELDKHPQKKIQWVPVEGSIETIVFKPGDLMNGDEINKDSLQMEMGFAEEAIKDLKVDDVVQFIRYGFVRKDKEEKNKSIFIFSS